MKTAKYDGLFDKLMDELEQQCDDDDIDFDKMVYHLLFDVLMACYDLIHAVCNEMNNECINRNIFDIFTVNIDTFYELEINNRMKRRIDFIKTYLRQEIINKIYKKIHAKHLKKYNDKNLIQDIHRFIIDCCQIIWCMLHYKYTLYPERFEAHDEEYNADIHNRDSDENIIDFYIFPALMNNENHITKIYVNCNDE